MCTFLICSSYKLQQLVHTFNACSCCSYTVQRLDHVYVPPQVIVLYFDKLVRSVHIDHYYYYLSYCRQLLLELIKLLVRALLLLYTFFTSLGENFIGTY